MPPGGRLAAPAGVLATVVLAVVPLSVAARQRHHHHGPIARPTWLRGVEVTEYFPAPESWFVGARVAAPGLAGTHRVDWLYSARGVVGEGDGLDLAGNPVHVEKLDGKGFIDDHGKRAPAGASRAPFWLSGGYWLTRRHLATFPLEAGGWSAGRGVRYRPPPARLAFAPGLSRPLSFYRSLAVDPRLIALGSQVFVPAYAGVAGASGWFIAEDTGGAIRGRHVDVFRPPPAEPRDAGQLLTAQRILVVPPGQTAPLEAGGSAAGGVRAPG
jgi:hypothetical protein